MQHETMNTLIVLASSSYLSAVFLNDIFCAFDVGNI
jgi:hypothetical protein